jgi:FkbM family methyltransferase
MIYSMPHLRVRSSLTLLDLQRYSIRETQVQCIDLSEFIFSLQRRIRFLKLDIEGSEIPVLHKLIDTGAIRSIDLVGVETHERLSPRLKDETNALRERIRSEDLGNRIRLDWL